jgi:TfoX/Sxy family transcriptional regulator of competence genes
MAFDEYLVERIKNVLKFKRILFEEKKMFGGWCAMVNGKMCIGVVKNELMARIDPDNYQGSLRLPGVRPMDFNGRPMNGYLFVGNEGIDSEEHLDHWVDQCLAFNPKAKSSKKDR